MKGFMKVAEYNYKGILNEVYFNEKEKYLITARSGFFLNTTKIRAEKRLDNKIFSITKEGFFLSEKYDLNLLQKGKYFNFAY